MKILARPDDSSIVSIRLSFSTGSAYESAGEEGVAHLCAALLAQGSTKKRSYADILNLLFPLASDLDVTADKEMITFETVCHADHVNQVYGLLRERLLEPAWTPDDFERVREDTRNAIAITLRGENDEELAKEALYGECFDGHPYSHYAFGTVRSLSAFTIDHVAAYHQPGILSRGLTAAIGGTYPDWLPRRIEEDFGAGEAALLKVPFPFEPDSNGALFIEKPARSVAVSLGYPIMVTRAHPDYAALLLAVSILGQHRQSSGRLFQRMRQIRGLNYGDYAYIEYFPGGMYELEPPVNLMRSREIFQLWIRPVAREQALFTIRLALYELERLIAEGITAEEFERGRNFLTKYTRLLVKTRSIELAYLIDSEFHGVPPHVEFLERQLAGLTLERVNEAIRLHLRPDRWKLVCTGPDMAGLRDAIVSNALSPMTYNAPKPVDIIAEDEIVSRKEIALREQNTRVVPVEEMFA